MYKKSIFWFRQDLRVFDNKWLIKASKLSKEVIPVFIFDEHIIKNEDDKRVLFVKDAVLNLKKELQKIGSDLLILKWHPEKLLPKLVKDYYIDAIFANKSYSTYWTNRDSLISDFMKLEEKTFDLSHDFLLLERDKIPTRKVFTPFFRLWKLAIKNENIKLENPETLLTFLPQNVKKYEFENKKHSYFNPEDWNILMENFDYENYDETRNIPSFINWTSKLAPYIRFWIISIRELYLKVKDVDSSYLSEIAWREFWHHIRYNFPEVDKVEFQKPKRNIAWKNDKILEHKFYSWETGFPIVDAAIRELKETNYMHNRCRMIVASFFTKNMLSDWKRGEKFFKDYLLDYDETVNIWNWQWSASVGADPKPIRIFNPCLQSEKFDKNCEYIRKFIPELEWFSNEQIHNPDKFDLKYAKPILDLKKTRVEALEEYKKSKRSIY